ncbi:hypothetical protein VL20_2337 [Microcystis panniformis FACHB-1757]|uniref:Uncharacterized protein n=1 Tax=Microcystis panniformis FACHB-1757 TaxID=1638788 RepID=A0A0K1S0E0_9CHRO|nr:hypothetical protein VL20_2337 [Microcystis panniformis FACHB-1757]
MHPYPQSVISDQLSVISGKLLVISKFTFVTVYWTATPCLWQH